MRPIFPLRIPRLFPILGLLAVLCGTAPAGSLVRISTPVGSVTLELYDQQRPITVQNFLTYIKKGRYANSISHRLIPNFVIQGGGFVVSGTSIDVVKTFAPIKNEYDGKPGFSNVKGTITMAKVDGNPNSATSQWFINLKNNNTGLPGDGNLDKQNGGFTVFGKVVSGLSTLDILNTSFADADTTSNLVHNALFELFDGNFTDLPLTSYNGGIMISSLFYTSFDILYEELPAVNTKAKVRTGKAIAQLKGKATPGSALIQWHIGPKGRVHQQKLDKLAWQLKAGGLKRGENVVYVRAVTTSGGRGAYRTVKVIRK